MIKKILRYLSAIFITSLFLLVRLALSSVLDDKIPYIMFIPAVAITTWLCGIAPGIFSVLLSFALAEAYIIQPMGTYTFDAAEATRFIIFSSSSFLVCSAIVLMRRNERRALLAEQQARENERRYSVATQSSRIGIWERNTKTGKTFYSESWKMMLGYPPDGTYSIEDLIHPDDRSRLVASVKDYVEKMSEHRTESRGKRAPYYEQEFRLRHNDGSYRWILSRGFLYVDAEGKPDLMCGSHVDITDIKLIEHELGQIKDRYDLAIKASGIAIWEWLPQKSPSDLLDLWENMLGLPEGIPAAEARQRLEGDDYHNAETTIKKYIRGLEGRDIAQNEFYEVEYRIYSKSGSICWYAVRGQAFLDQKNSIARIVGSRMDVTQRKTASEELISVERKYAAAMRAANLGVWEWSLITGEVYYSPGYKNMLGYAEDELNNELAVWENLLHPEDREATLSYVKKYIAQIESTPPNEPVSMYETEFRLRHKRGGYIWVLSRGFVFRNPDGKIRLLSGVHVDITDKKSQEEHLRNIAVDLDRSNKELEQFAYVVAHDLQEPLRMVRSYSELLNSDYKGALGNQADEFLNYIGEGAARAQTLVRDLLEYSRIGSRGKEFKLVALDEVVNQVLKILNMRIQEKNAMISREPLPVIYGDPTQMHQLFLNLLGNALKYTERPPKIRISAAMEDNRWVVSVEDNGIGIAPQFHRYVFEIFKRLHSASQYTGTGVGLALCKKIVERHGGSIWVESQAGAGAIFRFTLPVVQKSGALFSSSLSS